MEKYEQEKWLEELAGCFPGGSVTWEGIMNNLGLFFMNHERTDIGRILLEFTCANGEYPQMAMYNLSTVYLALVKAITEDAIKAKSPPVDISNIPEGHCHPDRLVNELMKRRDLLKNVE